MSNNEPLKLHGEKCFLNSRLVKPHYDLASPFFEAYEHTGFEYCDNFSCDESSVPSLISQYSSPYCQTAVSFPAHTFLEEKHFFKPSPVMLRLCADCSNLPPLCKTCKKQTDRRSCRQRPVCKSLCAFTRELCIELKINPDYACPDDRGNAQYSKCAKCHFCEDSGTLPGDIWTITVHDLRLMGYSVIVKINYRYSRCKHKQKFLQSIPGIHSGSESNQIRYSVRLAEAIEIALVETRRLDYISEASGISYDSVRHWRDRETKRIMKAARDIIIQYLASSSMDFESQAIPLLFDGEEKVLCLQRRNGEIIVSGIYSKSMWEAFMDLSGKKHLKKTKFFELTGATGLENLSDFNLIFDYCALHSFIEPALATYIVYRILLYASEWRFPPLLELSSELREFYEECWRLFEDTFLPDIADKINYLELLPFVFQRTGEYRDERDLLVDNRKMQIWYGNVSEMARERRISLAHSKHAVMFFDTASIEQYTRSFDVQADEALILLQYYNPAMMQNGIESVSDGERTVPRFRYLFDENGDMCLPDRTKKMPFVTLNDFVKLLRAGILQEQDPDADLLSTRMMLTDS